MVTGGIHGTSREWFYDSLGLDSNSKSFTTRLPLFLSRFLFSRKFFFKTSSTSVIRPVLTRTKSFKGTFFFHIVKINGINLN